MSVLNTKGLRALAIGLGLGGLGLAALGLAGVTSAQAADEQRVVSVGGSVTEIVYALGEQDRLIARDSTSMYPHEAMELPDVGYMRALSPEGVLSVNPELILLNDGSGPAETLDVLEKSNVKMVTIPDHFTADGIVEKVRAVGEALGVPEKGEELAAKVAADLQAAQEEVAGRNDGLKVLFVLSYRDGRVMASGARTQASSIIELAGATNATPDFFGYKQLSDEAILQAQPDVVLMMDNGHGNAVDAETLFSHPALGATPAGKNKRLVTMPGLYLLGFGPRTADAIRDLAVKLTEISG